MIFLEAINNFIDWFKSIIDAVSEFFASVVETATQLYEYISYAAEMAYKLVASLPPWLQAFATVTVLVSILFMVLGRETGGAKNE